MIWLKEIMGLRMQQRQLDQLVDLHLIHQMDLNLVYCSRKTDIEIINYAKLLFQHSFKGINELVTPDTLNTVLTQSLDEFGFQTVGKVKLKEDITRLTKLFFSITQATTLRLVLKVVAHDACTKFHTDAYDLRLLCTYAGRGTEWIADQYVNRNKLIRGSNNDIIRDFTQVRSLQQFDVAILKGEIPSRPQTKGIVHRSPPIEQTNEKRLLLRLDFQS